jgi:outer membrane protein OmpA-like peptidoglycan-associated protein
LSIIYSHIVILSLLTMTFYRLSSSFAVASPRTHRCAVGATPLFAGYVLNPSLFLLDIRVRVGKATPTSEVGEALSPPPFLRRHIHFACSTSTLEKTEIRCISQGASWLHAHPAARVLVVGFCDSTGSENCNHKLARKRAETVRRLLIKYGAAPKQMVASTNWDSAGSCSAKTNRCQQQNRSVSIFLASPQ